MANQHSSFQKIEIAGGLSANSRQMNALLAAAVVMVVVTIVAFALVLNGNQAPVIEQQPAAPAVAPAQLDRHEVVRGAVEENSIAPSDLTGEVGQYLTQPDWLQVREYEIETARKAASEAAQARWAMEHGR